MPEDQDNQQAKDSQGQGQSGEGEKEFIQLDKETYAAILDKMDEYEELLKAKGGQQSKDKVDELIDEGKEKSQQQVNLDEMSPSQVAQYVTRHVLDTMINPLAIRLEEIRIQNEIDLLTRPKEMGGKGIADFWDYENEVYEIASNNPKISLKEAYELAKVRHGEQPRKQAFDKRKRDERLRHLPSIEPFGERPGSAEAGTKRGEPATLKDAAERAVEESLAGLKES